MRDAQIAWGSNIVSSFPRRLQWEQPADNWRQSSQKAGQWSQKVESL